MDKLKRIAFMFCVLLQLQQVTNASPYEDSGKIDSAQLVKEFIEVCTNYKAAPLSLKLKYAGSTNYISSVSDTLKAEGMFYMTETASYIKFGEVEELVNDSLALIVSSEIKRMILFTNVKPVLTQMKAMLGMAAPDLSLKNFSNHYTVSKSIENDGHATFHLSTHAVLNSTNLPLEEITLSYYNDTKVPIRVIKNKRSLVPLTPKEAKRFLEEPVLKDKLVTIKGSVFLIKEQLSAFYYEEIKHSAQIKVPVLATERITKNVNGKYVPARAYESFIITAGD